MNYVYVLHTYMCTHNIRHIVYMCVTSILVFLNWMPLHIHDKVVHDGRQSARRSWKKSWTRPGRLSGGFSCLICLLYRFWMTLEQRFLGYQGTTRTQDDNWSFIAFFFILGLLGSDQLGESPQDSFASLPGSASSVLRERGAKGVLNTERSNNT